MNNSIYLLTERASRVGLITVFSVCYSEKNNSSRTNLLIHLANPNNKILQVIPRASKHLFERLEQIWKTV